MRIRISSDNWHTWCVKLEHQTFIDMWLYNLCNVYRCEFSFLFFFLDKSGVTIESLYKYAKMGFFISNKKQNKWNEVHICFVHKRVKWHSIHTELNKLIRSGLLRQGPHKTDENEPLSMCHGSKTLAADALQISWILGPVLILMSHL